MKPLAVTAFVVCLYPITAFAANFDQADRYDWSGYSVGAFVGGVSADIQGTELHTDAFGGASWFPPGPGRDYDFHASGLTAGGQVGWDMQRDNMVFGIGGEVGVLDLNASGGDPNAPPAPQDDATPITSFKSGLYGALTARAGVAVHRLLIYGRAGVALVDARAGTIDTCDDDNCGPLTIDASNRAAVFGFTGGGGVEYALTDNVSIGAEYRLFALQPVHVSGIASNALEYHQDVGPRIVQTGRVSLNFHF